MKRRFTLLLGLTVLALLAAACAAPTTTPAMKMEDKSSGMAGMQLDTPNAPAGKAYAEEQKIYFIHTEVSDEGVAKVYVFKNGLKGMGPLGFQPDVFDNLPGTDGYRPLRQLVLVTWKDKKAVREMKSLAEVQAAVDKGEITLEESGVVINMPFLKWPAGQRGSRCSAFTIDQLKTRGPCNHTAFALSTC